MPNSYIDSFLYKKAGVFAESHREETETPTIIPSFYVRCHTFAKT